MKRNEKWILGTICTAVIVAVIFAFSFHKAILVEAGRFMAPEVHQIEGVADVVILEGATFIDRKIVSRGIELVSSGKARRIVLVLHSISPKRMPFAVQEDYPSSVRLELQKLGLKDSDFAVMVTPLRGPITLAAARFVLENLARDGIKKAILVSWGFHMRRSYLVYQHLAAPLNIKIYPMAIGYDVNNWWNQTDGPRDFLLEIQKLTFYMAKGYIPLKFFD